MSWGSRRQATPGRRNRILLGTYGSALFPKRLERGIDELQCHGFLEGKTGKGKSRYFASLLLSWMACGGGETSCTLLDPHQDTAALILDYLIANGYFRQPDAFERLIYLDIAAAARQGRYLPFNLLAMPLPREEIAALFLEAMHRAYPELASGSPTFDTLLVDCLYVLLAAGQPITALPALLVDADARARMLTAETDPDVLRFFTQFFARLKPQEALNYAGSVYRRARLLTRYPILGEALSSSHGTVLDWDAIRRKRQHVLISLGGLPKEVLRLYGCLITTTAEAHARSLARYSAQERRPRAGQLVLFVDEFHLFLSQSIEQFTAMLSETRKFGLFLWLTSQNASQMGDRMRGALGNADFRAVFALDDADARAYAELLSRPDPLAIKYEVANAAARDNHSPVFYSIAEQVYGMQSAIKQLGKQEAFVKLPDDSITRVRTPLLADPIVDPAERAAITQRYLDTYFHPSAVPVPDSSPPPPPPAAFGLVDEEVIDDD